MPALLEIRGLHAAYGSVRVLDGIDMDLAEGRVTALLGANGAGKTTTLRAICRHLVDTRGEVRLAGERIDRHSTERIARQGVGHVPDGRGTFAQLSAEENLRLGAQARPTRAARADVAGDMERMFGYFPRLRERRTQQAGTLSGGEQQMLAVARILRTGARLLLLDEISEGLAPVIVQALARMITMLRTKGYTVVMVEQNFHFAAPLADRFYVVEHGHVVERFGAAELQAKMPVLNELLGV